MTSLERKQPWSIWEDEEHGPSSPGCGLRAWGSSSSESRVRAVGACGVVAGRYRLVRLLAKGGMGTVWEAVDLMGPRPGGERLALKLMSGGLGASSSSRERFLREAALASALTGPEFPRVFTYGVDGAVPFIVLELLEGDTVAARLARAGSLSVRECRWLAEDVCAGLSLAHSFGVVHRDIHPKNLFWLSARAGERSQLKILDFGVAKPLAQESKLTEFGTLIGCAQYMSPEQIRSGRAVCGQSDFWSVGAILYRALLGRLPFVGNAGAVLASITRDAPPRPSAVAPVSRAVDEFFDVALAKDPAKRFPNARVMVEAFADATAHFHPEAAPGAAWRVRLFRSSKPAINDAEAVTTVGPPITPTPRRSEPPGRSADNAVTVLATPRRPAPLSLPPPPTARSSALSAVLVLAALVIAAWVGTLLGAR